jgi:hypothetical protein
MDLRLAHHFLRTNEWKYLVEVFRYHFRDGNANIKTWQAEKDNRWDDTIETLTSVEFAMLGLENAVKVHNGAGIRAFEVSLVQLVQDALEHFHTRIRSGNDLCRARYDSVKMEFVRDGALVECHRLFGGVKYVRLCVLLRRMYEVLQGDKHLSVSESWPEFTKWPGSLGYQVAAQPVLMFPVLQPDGSIAAAVPLKPTTAQDEEEERLLDRHPLAGAALAGPARMHAMLHHMNRLTMS